MVRAGERCGRRWPTRTILRAVTGGFVVRDPRLSRIAGREIIGRYIFGDFCTGTLFAFRITPEGRSKKRSFRFKLPSLSSFGEDRDGRIYLIQQLGPFATER